MSGLGDRIVRAGLVGLAALSIPIGGGQRTAEPMRPVDLVAEASSFVVATDERDRPLYATHLLCKVAPDAPVDFVQMAIDGRYFAEGDHIVDAAVGLDPFEHRLRCYVRLENGSSFYEIVPFWVPHADERLI